MLAAYIQECLIELFNSIKKLQSEIDENTFFPEDAPEIYDIIEKTEGTVLALRKINFEKLKLTENLQNELINNIKRINLHFIKGSDEFLENFTSIKKAFKNLEHKADTVLSLNETNVLYNEKDDQLKRIQAILSSQSLQLEELTHKLVKTQDTVLEKAKEMIVFGLDQAKDNIAIDKTITKTASKQVRILSKRESRASCYWVVCGVICMAIALTYAGTCMHLRLQDYALEPRLRNNFNENIQIALLFKDAFKSLFIVSVLASLSFMCFKQYKAHRRNHVLYEHKYFALHAFNAFMSNTILSDTRNIIVEKAMDSIFKNPDFLDHPSSDTSEKSGDIIQTIKTALPSMENK